MVYEPPSVRCLTTDAEVQPARPSEYTISLSVTRSSVLSENPRNKILEEMVVWAVLSNVNELRHCFLLSSDNAHSRDSVRIIAHSLSQDCISGTNK
jgi:hypothetical protein